AKVYTYEEVSSHTTADDLWMVINGKVYDCTKFVDEHPGGEEVLVDCGGQEATQSFEDVGHSEDASTILEKLYIGDLHPDEVPIKKNSSVFATGSEGSSSSNSLLLLTVAAIVAALAFFYL
ncbi:cytochrome b5, partial [Nadsonia fulvescens var. elongata DSM 6958]